MNLGNAHRRAAVLGSPIAHSLSPALHLAAYAALGLHWSYEAIEVDETTLPEFLTGLDDTWAGLSLTRPLKEAVIPLLSDVDEVARRVGAVNTVVPGPHGFRGLNTDVLGIVDSVRGIQDHAPATATVLGAGATARSAIAALAELGASDITICSRRREPADECVALAAQWNIPARWASFEPTMDLVAADVLISTLPGDVAAPWAQEVAHAEGALLDASYHPWPTPLAAAWPSSRVASGRDMLLWQAVEQVRLMTGMEPPVAVMSAALPV